MKSKKVSIPFGTDVFEIAVPHRTEVLSMKQVKSIPAPMKALANALSHPIGTPRLEEIIGKKGTPRNLTAAIAISDSTRPVPYREEEGILMPLLRILDEAGMKNENIRLIVATGMHRPSTREEKVNMLGEWIVDHYHIEDHDCGNPSGLTYVGKTKSGTKVSVNRKFLEADLKICTGLVESHFMAGFSGGRKSICPGLVDSGTLQRFHGPDFLNDERADNLVMAGNPCHEEALEVATMVGCDFILNATVDGDHRMTGVYAGDMVKAHLKACEDVIDAVRIPISVQYDIVITHGGYVGMNHYQTAKAACGALPAIKEGGKLIIVACNSEAEPVGSGEYRSLLHLLKLQGPDTYTDILKAPSWKFTKDQWEPQMWGRVIKKVGENGIIYVSPHISEEDFALLPCISGYAFLDREARMGNHLATARCMAQEAINRVYANCRGITKPTVAFLKDGPYGIPVYGKDRQKETIIFRRKGGEYGDTPDDDV